MKLNFILTYDCNFRCSYCDIDKRKGDKISKKIIDDSLEFIKTLPYEIDEVKFFGGEPLIHKDYIYYIVDKYNFGDPNFYVTTNSTLVNDEFIDFSRKNNIKVTFSIDGDEDTTAGNRKTFKGQNLYSIVNKNLQKYVPFVRVNQVITSDTSDKMVKNFLYLYDKGVRDFNFLPEYFNYWSKEGFGRLIEGFSQILELYQKGYKFTLVNLENYQELAFFNIGIIIDTDGKIYGTNQVLSGIFEKYKPDLIIGDIYEGMYFTMDDSFIEEYRQKLYRVQKLEYDKKVRKSVYYVDLILNDFVAKFKKLNGI